MTRVPYEPELLPALEQVRSMSGPTLRPESVPLIRERIAEAAAGIDRGRLQDEHGVRIRDVTAGPSGCLATVIEPRRQPVGAMMHVHGGGMMMGHRLESLPELAATSARTGAVVVTVDYRLAPEHPFPAAADDLWGWWEWMQEQAPALGFSSRSVILSGTSAGGGLAAGLALRLRDRGAPAPLAVSLLAPMLDDRNTTGSAQAYVATSAWDRDANALGWSAFLGGASGPVSPYAAPARAGSLAGLPPLYLEAGSAEVFRDEVVEFASRVWVEGGSADLHVWAGAFHGFERFAAGTRLAAAAREARVSWWERQWRRGQG